MATEAVAAPARPEAALPYGARFLLTIFLLALYWFARRLPLPGVDMMAVLEFSRFAQSPETARNLSVVALGFGPLITGFLLVELFALLTSPGRRLRKGGGAGRATLNRAALITALVIAGVQAAGISQFLEAMTTPGGAPLVPSPGWAFRLIVIATLTAMTAAVFVLGNVISDYGIGNGFALLILATWAGSFVEMAAPLGMDGVGGSTVAGAGLLGAAVLMGLLVRFFRGSDAAQVPAFPQSLLPVQLFWVIFAWAVWLASQGQPAPWDLTWAQTVTALILVPLLSWIGFHLFSSRPRLEANVPEPDEVVDRLAITLRRRLLPSTALLTLGAAALLAWGHFQPMTLAAGLDFARLVATVAIGLDLWDQLVFLREPQGTARLVQLDNVHFAYRLVARLREEEIEPLARALHFRSLFFFFGALFKIDVLVPLRHLERSREILAQLETAREIKAF